MNQLCLPNVITALFWLLQRTWQPQIEVCFFFKKKKKGLYILHFYPKSTRVVSLQNNTSITGISEPKLDSSILNSEVDIKGYDLV